MPRTLFDKLSPPLAVLLAAAACGPGHAPGAAAIGEDVDRCADAAHDAGGGEREVAIGRYDGAFAPYEQGEHVAVELGFQGGYMITPTVRVAAQPDDGDAPCLHLRIVQILVGGGDVGPGIDASVVFRRESDALFVGPIFDLLGFEREPLVGRTLELAVTVSGATLQGDTHASIVLE